jgi:hypothetical protein
MNFYDVLVGALESTRYVPSGPIHLPNHWSVPFAAGGAAVDFGGGLLVELDNDPAG